MALCADLVYYTIDIPGLRDLAANLLAEETLRQLPLACYTGACSRVAPIVILGAAAFAIGAIVGRILAPEEEKKEKKAPAERPQARDAAVQTESEIAGEQPRLRSAT